MNRKVKKSLDEVIRQIWRMVNATEHNDRLLVGQCLCEALKVYSKVIEEHAVKVTAEGMGEN